MARKNEKGAAKRSGDKKFKEDPLQNQGSLRKSAEVNEDVFATEFMKPRRTSVTEGRSPASTDTASGKVPAPQEDALEKKNSRQEEGRHEEKGASTDTAGTTDSKGEADKAKGDETAEKGEEDREKVTASAEKHDEHVVSDKGETTEKPSRAPDDEGNRNKCKGKDDRDFLASNKLVTKEERVSGQDPARISKEGSSGGVEKKGGSISNDDKKKAEERTKILLSPNKPDAISEVISAAVNSAMPEEVKEAGENFEKAENAFMQARKRAEELVQKSKQDTKEDDDAKKELHGEAVAATAEAVVAEAAAREALKGEVRAFLGMDEMQRKDAASERQAAEKEEKNEKREASTEVKEEASARKTPDKEDAAAVCARNEQEGANSQEVQDATEGERGATAEKARSLSRAAGHERVKGDGGAEEKLEGGKEVRVSSVSPPLAQVKISPAHLLDYSKRRASDREAILAALAVVGLDTPETRRVVEAAEQEAAALAEQEAAAAAAKVAAEEAGGRQAVLAKLNAFQKQTLAKLEGNQQYVTLLEERLQEELAALRDKYDRLMEPVFDERARILFTGGDEDEEARTGKSETMTEAEDGRKQTSSENAAELRAAAMKDEVGTRALPGFWLQAFSNHHLLSAVIGQRDRPLLLYLQNVRRVLHPEKAEGFSLVFEFGENPFFAPETLTKTFRMREEEDGGDWVVARTEGTPIQWAEGMDVTMRIIMRRQLNMRTKSERMVKEIITERSFFHFFKNSVVPTDEELDAMAEEEQANLFKVLKTEFDVGVVIRDLIIPRAVDWYLGTATDEFERSSDESESQIDAPARRPKEHTTSAAATESSETGAEDTANSIASWFGF